MPGRARTSVAALVLVGLGSSCLENTDPPQLGFADRRRPHGRLADPGLALDEQRSGLDRDAVKEAPGRSELDFAADDGAGRHRRPCAITS